MWRCTRDAISSPPWPRLCCVGQGVRRRRERERGQSKARWEERLQVPHIPAVPLVRGGAAAGTREQCLRFVTASWCGSLVRATNPRTRIRMIDFGVVRSPFSSICERGRRQFFARGVRAAVGRVRRARVAGACAACPRALDAPGTCRAVGPVAYSYMDVSDRDCVGTEYSRVYKTPLHEFNFRAAGRARAPAPATGTRVACDVADGSQTTSCGPRNMLCIEIHARPLLAAHSADMQEARTTHIHVSVAAACCTSRAPFSISPARPRSRPPPPSQAVPPARPPPPRRR